MTIIVINGNLALISGGKVLIITREIDYAIRVLRAISDNELHSVQKMSETEDIPCHFAYKIVKKLEKAGLLIINGLGNPSRANETAYSFLQDVLSARSIAGRINMLVTAPQGDLLGKIATGERFKRKDVVATFLKLFPVSYQMHDKIFGVDVHMPFIDCLEINNECRQTTVI